MCHNEPDGDHDGPARDDCPAGLGRGGVGASPCRDVRIPATALRVMVAHGSFTPTGTDSLTKAGADALQRLSDVLLKECERRFGAWLPGMLAKQGEAA